MSEAFFPTMEPEIQLEELDARVAENVVFWRMFRYLQWHIPQLPICEEFAQDIHCFAAQIADQDAEYSGPSWRKLMREIDWVALSRAGGPYISLPVVELFGWFREIFDNHVPTHLARTIAVLRMDQLQYDTPLIRFSVAGREALLRITEEGERVLGLKGSIRLQVIGDFIRDPVSVSPPL